MALALLAFAGAKAVAERAAQADEGGGGRSRPEGTRRARLVLESPRGDPGGIRGHVIGSKGEPLAAALVCAWSRQSEPGARAANLLRCDEAASGGAFALGGLPDGDYVVSASAEGYLPVPSSSVEVRLAVSDVRDGVALVLARGGIPLKGRILDAMGGPIPGATVIAQPASDGTLPSMGRSDVDGRYVLSVPETGGRLSAEADGYARGRRPFTAPSEQADVVLTPGGSVEGRVVDDATGSPVSHVSVAVRRIAPGDPPSTAEVDEIGRFRLDALPAGSYEISARGERWSSPAASTVALGVADVVSGVEVRVVQGAVVTGTVLRGREPCEAKKGSVRLRGRSSLSELTDGSGRVRFEGVSPGEYVAVVHCEGARPLTENLSVDGRGIADAEWTLDEGQSIRGTVRTFDGRPAPAVRIDVAGMTAGAQDVACLSGQDGRFTCSGLTEGSYECFASGERGLLSEKVQVAAGHDTDVALRLIPIGELRVLVLDETGAPIPDLPAFARDSRGSLFGGARQASGETHVTELDPGAYAVFAGPPSEPLGAAEHVDVQAGATASVTIRSERPSGEMSGRVVDEHGAGVPDAFVKANLWAPVTPDNASYVSPVATDAGGAFRIGGLIEGSYGLRVDHHSLGTTSILEARTGTSIQVELSGPASMAGIVRTLSGEPATAFAIEYFGPTEGGRREFSTTTGAWALPRVRAGAWTLRVTGAKGVATKQLSLAPGEDSRDLEMVLDDTESVSAWPVGGATP